MSRDGILDANTIPNSNLSYYTINRHLHAPNGWLTRTRLHQSKVCLSGVDNAELATHLSSVPLAHCCLSDLEPCFAGSHMILISCFPATCTAVISWGSPDDPTLTVAFVMPAPSNRYLLASL